MTDTLLSSATKELTIGFGRPFVMIGERINPTAVSYTHLTLPTIYSV